MRIEARLRDRERDAQRLARVGCVGRCKRPDQPNARGERDHGERNRHDRISPYWFDVVAHEPPVSAPHYERQSAMEMKKLAGGNLRALGYDDRRRALVVELTSGTFEYAGVSADTYRRMLTASSPWSFFRDNIEEEFPAKRLR